MKYIYPILVAVCICASSLSVHAVTDVYVNVWSGTSVEELSAKIRILEARLREVQEENTALKNGKNASTTSISTGTKTSTGWVSTSSAYTAPVSTASTSTPSKNIVQSTIDNGARYAGFMARMDVDWAVVADVYDFPETASIGMYEFVSTGSDNNVFVDILYATGTLTGSYDAKLLYEYDTKTYERKLVGFFVYEPTTGKYTTKRGGNPFGGVDRKKIRNPYLSATYTTPTIPVVPTTPVVPTASTTDIETAYKAKKYLSVISLSDTYLAANAPTVPVLRMRYRTFFIIWKYEESIKEIDRIVDIAGTAVDKAVVCDGQVIAAYSKSTATKDKYTKLCASKK